MQAIFVSLSFLVFSEIVHFNVKCEPVRLASQQIGHQIYATVVVSRSPHRLALFLCVCVFQHKFVLLANQWAVCWDKGIHKATFQTNWKVWSIVHNRNTCGLIHNWLVTIFVLAIFQLVKYTRWDAISMYIVWLERYFAKFNN